MMDCVEKGGNRQELHEVIRENSMLAGRHVKEEGKDNDLLKLLAEDERLGKKFGITEDELKRNLKPENYIGLADIQVTDFIEQCVDPLLKEYGDVSDISAEINV